MTVKELKEILEERQDYEEVFIDFGLGCIELDNVNERNDFIILEPRSE